MMNRKRKINWPSLILLIVLAIVYFSMGGGAVKDAPAPTSAAVQTQTARAAAVPMSTDATVPPGKPGEREAVASYIRQHGELPDYYITKAQARQLGWEGGSVERFAPGKLIGGDRFGNFEGALPSKKGRTYTECDINTWGKSSRGAERIVFSNDGLIFYTDDHYETFTQLEGR